MFSLNRVTFLDLEADKRHHTYTISRAISLHFASPSLLTKGLIFCLIIFNEVRTVGNNSLFMEKSENLQSLYHYGEETIRMCSV